MEGRGPADLNLDLMRKSQVRHDQMVICNLGSSDGWSEVAGAGLLAATGVFALLGGTLAGWLSDR